MNLHRLCFLTLFFLAACLNAVAQSNTSAPDTTTAFAGKWVGTFEGASSGSCEMALSQDASGKLSGILTIIPGDGNRYPVTFKSVSTQGTTLNAAYADPSDGDEVTLEGTRTGQVLKGTWKADGGASTGTWQVTREGK